MRINESGVQKLITYPLKRPILSRFTNRRIFSIIIVNYYILGLCALNTKDITRIFENSKTEFLLCDADFTILFVSKGLAGVPLAVGQNLFALFPDQKEELPLLVKKLQTGSPYHSTKFEFFSQNDTIFFLPILEDGQLMQILCCISSSSLRENDLWDNKILAAISDRYRSPAMSIFNIMSLLASRLQAAEDYKALEYLNESTGYCYDILRSSTELHDYAMLIHGKTTLAPTKQLLNAFVRNLCNTLAVVFRNTQYQFRCDTCEEMIVTAFDERLLSLAIFHLVANACRFSPSDSTITIRLDKRGESVLLTVSDEGVGIASADMEHIFEPFYTNPGMPVGEEGMGIGLGLPIVKKIMELHRGQIYVTSEKNRGTKVALSLPIIDDPSLQHTLQSDSVRYISDRFSDLYILLSGFCNMKFF